MKVQVKTAFTSYFFVTQKNIEKADNRCMKSSTPMCSRCLTPLFQNQIPVQDKQNGKPTQCQAPPQFFRIHLKDKSSNTFTDLLRLYSSRNFVVFSLKTVYPTKAGENFQLYGCMVFKLLENTCMPCLMFHSVHIHSWTF